MDLGETESLGKMAGGGGDSYSSPSEQYKITPLSNKQDTGQDSRPPLPQKQL